MPELSPPGPLHGFRLACPPGVYTPQRDSGLLLEVLGAERAQPGATSLDVCTGSGVLALAAARAGFAASAVDLDCRSARTARLNAHLNRLDVEVHRGDLFAPFHGRTFDLITANPPYVPTPPRAPRERGSQAWNAGRDGRLLIDRICAEVPGRLAPGGALLLVHSSLSRPHETVASLERSGLEVEVAAECRERLGPVSLERRGFLERSGALEHGADVERLVVVRARSAREPVRAARVICDLPTRTAGAAAAPSASSS